MISQTFNLGFLECGHDIAVGTEVYDFRFRVSEVQSQ